MFPLAPDQIKAQMWPNRVQVVEMWQCSINVVHYIITAVQLRWKQSVGHPILLPLPSLLYSPPSPFLPLSLLIPFPCLWVGLVLVQTTAFATFDGNSGVGVFYPGISRILGAHSNKIPTAVSPCFRVRRFNDATSGIAWRRHPPEIQDGSRQNEMYILRLCGWWKTISNTQWANTVSSTKYPDTIQKYHTQHWCVL